MILLHNSFRSAEIHSALMILHHLFFSLLFCFSEMFSAECWSFFIFKSFKYELKQKLFSLQSHTVLTTTLFFFIRWSQKIQLFIFLALQHHVFTEQWLKQFRNSIVAKVSHRVSRVANAQSDHLRTAFLFLNFSSEFSHSTILRCQQCHCSCH